MHLFNPLHWENNFCAFTTLGTWNHPTSANLSKLLGFNTLDHQHCTWTIKLVIIWLKGGMGLKIFSTQIKGFQNLITNTVWKISKSITLPPKRVFKFQQEIKSKTFARFKHATNRFLSYPLNDHAIWKVFKLFTIYTYKLVMRVIVSQGVNYNRCKAEVIVHVQGNHKLAMPKIPIIIILLYRTAQWYSSYGK